MPRKPEVFVPELSMAERQRLQWLTRTSKDPIKLRRATIVMASVQGQAVSDIAHMLATTWGYARKVIHAFNDQGLVVWTQNGVAVQRCGS